MINREYANISKDDVSIEIVKTPDFIIYEKFKDNFSKLSFEYYNKYMNLINKKAKIYERNSRGKIQSEDFCSDVYIELHNMVRSLKEYKMQPDKFMFYAYIKYAISKVYNKNMKIVKREVNFENDPYLDIKSEENYKTPTSFVFGHLESKMCCSDNVDEILNDIIKPQFMAKLTDRQKFIFKNLQNGKTYNDIRHELKCSHGTVAGDVWRAKNLIKEMF